jgi:hypothetical protein
MSSLGIGRLQPLTTEISDDQQQTAPSTTNCDLRLKTDLSHFVCYYRQSVGQPVLVSDTLLGPMARFLLLSDSCGFVDVRRPLWQVIYNYCRALPGQSFLGRSPTGLVTIFYRPKFENPLTWRARGPQEQGGPVLPPDTGFNQLHSLITFPFKPHSLLN